MMRFVIGLLAVVSVYFGWQWYADKGSSAQGQTPAGELFQSAGASSAELDAAAKAAAAQVAGPGGAEGSLQEVASKGTASQGAASQGAVALDVQRSAGEILRKIAAGDVETLKSGFRLAVEAEEPLRGQILEALTEVGGRAKDADAKLRVLGAGNDFLHTEAGRKLAIRTANELQRLPREIALSKSSGLLQKCMQGAIEKAHETAYETVNQIYRQHRILVDQVLFNPGRMTKARSHKVKPGETLGGIARKFRAQGIEVEGWTLCYLNRISRPNRLQAGKVIKIPMEPISAKVVKASFLMAVYVGDTIARMYWVGHGKEANSTPETTFTVIEKIADPDWNAPDGEKYPFGHPKNVLGRHFVKFGHESLHGFGAHGTTEPDSIRTRSSLGCIRMLDADIEEFFRFMPRRCTIEVVSGI